jgi:hypothetical protein
MQNADPDIPILKKPRRIAVNRCIGFAVGRRLLDRRNTCRDESATSEGDN